MKRAPTVLLPVSLAVLAACGGDVSREEGVPASDSVGVGSSREAGVPAGDAAGQMDADADTGGVRLYPLRLVNPRFYPIVVFASARAREVLLDTVAARDSSRLNVQVAAGLLRLRAVDLEGNELGVAVLSTWRDHPPGGAEGGARRGVDSLSWELPPPP
ncbi:MAG: hypothetical protein KAJ67_09980 [Gemmatimonadetes bacterium]|nr:hypothetical protein [Gemmatimonadota bacterium]